MSPAARTAAAALLLAAATLPVLSRQYFGGAARDLTTYMRGVEGLLQGRLYANVPFEYPPYALIWFLPPYFWSHDLQSFRFAFGFEIWLFDAAIKAALLWRGIRGRQGFPDLIPFLAYSVGSAALGYFLLMRYDVIPGALSLAAALAVTGGRPLLGGATMALAAGTKVYPALFIPVLAVIAWRRGDHDLRRFALGVAIATAPLVLLAAWMPWWNFASFHGSRGLQAESLLASIVWALHFTSVEATWGVVTTSHEVGGPLARALLWPGRLLWVAATLACFGAAVAAALRMALTRVDDGTPVASVATLLLLTVVAFVATNTVFSPQFHLWLIPLAALVLEGRGSRGGGVPRQAVRAACLVFIATIIVPTFYPHREYTSGLGLMRTATLLLRNVLMLYAMVCLWRAAAELRHDTLLR